MSTLYNFVTFQNIIKYAKNIPRSRKFFHLGFMAFTDFTSQMGFDFLEYLVCVSYTSCSPSYLKYSPHDKGGTLNVSFAITKQNNYVVDILSRTDKTIQQTSPYINFNLQSMDETSAHL